MSLWYIDPADLPTYYHTGRVLELASDTKIPAAAADLGTAASPGYKIVLAAIQYAAGELDSHCQMGRRYYRADLENIIADAASNPTDQAKQKRAALIRQIVADIAFGTLMARKGQTEAQFKQFAPRYDVALQTLERLAAGVQVFDLDSALDAGVPSVHRIGSKRYRPSKGNPMFGVWPDGCWGDWFGRSDVNF